MRFFCVLPFVVLCVGCVTPAQNTSPSYTISAPYDAAEAQAQLRDGTATIKGNAFMRQRGGGVVTCAGSSVRLIPSTAYARQRISALYGNMKAGATQRTMRFEPDPPEYAGFTKIARCDATGNFQFDRVAAGSYFVTTTVVWTAGSRPQGGALMSRADVPEGQTVSLVLAD